MAIFHHRHTLSSSSSISSSSSYSPSLLDALYCEEEEEQWEELEGEQETGEIEKSPSLFHILLLEQDMFWEDEELLSLFSKEEQIFLNVQGSDPSSGSCYLSFARREAVEWMLKVNSHYGFSTLTAILSINYLDRFLSKCPHLDQREKPWMIQLAAVTCLSLAAKVEETHVPFLLDLQVEDTRYVFEAKTIQRMELLVLSTLNWKMNPVTPISFLDHIIRRHGLKNHLHWEFLRRCEQVLLSVVAESRFVSFQPSVLATATMMHVIDQIEPSNPLNYQTQLLGVLNIAKEKVKNCYELIVEEASKNVIAPIEITPQGSGNKRKREIPGSPSGVIDVHCFSSDDSNHSWTTLTGGSSSTSASPALRKRVHEQYMPLRVFVDGINN